jgi:hypothetical protein
MFGPLNGVRTALVIGAALAAIVSLFAGYPEAAAILGVGILVHGLGWGYLYLNRDRTGTEARGSEPDRRRQGGPE